MKAVGIYFSSTHTTQKTVRAVLKGIGLPFEEIDLTLPAARAAFFAAPHLFDKDTVAVLGAPVYGGDCMPLFLKCLSLCKAQGTPAVLVAQYGNRHYEEALRQMYMAARGAGFVPVAAGAFIGEHSFTSRIAEGRPSEADLAEAASFGATAAAKLQAAKEAAALPLEKVPFRGKDTKTIGEHRENAQKSGKVGPAVTSACTRCGSCVKVCPTGLLSLGDEGIEAKGEMCLRCRACARVCPVSAIDFTDPFSQAIVENCLANFGRPDRKNEVSL